MPFWMPSSTSAGSKAPAATNVHPILGKTGVEDNTLVIFTSDHGDCTGAHRFNQKTVFYEESVRIPLIVSWKGRTLPATRD